MGLKNLFRSIALLGLAALACGTAPAQNLGYVGQTNSNQSVFAAISTAQASAPLINLGQNFHILCYTATSGTAVFQLRLEFSFNGTTYNPLSDDASSQSSGCVYGQGSYPYIRANLLYFSGSGTLTANYTGIFSGSMPPTGALNQSQQFKKYVANNITSSGSTVNYNLNPPCANTGGTLYVDYISGGGAGTITLSSGSDSQFINSGIGQIFSLTNTANQQAFFISPQSATYIQLGVSAAAASVYSIQYVFNCPAGGQGLSGMQVTGMVQPYSYNSSASGGSNNAEYTATAAAISHTYGANTGQRISFFSISARCSAGTAGIIIQDAATTIWSTGAAEVGTTTFKFQWNPGLATGIGDAATIQMTSCGGGNTGTLDIQASQN